MTRPAKTVDPAKIIPRVRRLGRLQPIDSRQMARLTYECGAGVRAAVDTLISRGELVPVVIDHPRPHSGQPSTTLLIPAAALKAQMAYWAATGITVRANEQEADTSA